MQVYLVGGAVRDQLLGRAVKERDWVVVGATPEQMLEQGYQQVGKDFPVFIHPQSGEEYALARTERKTGPGYKGFSFYAAPDVTLEQDLIRRDLTINAIAEDEQGNIIDPYQGQQDLEQRILRHVSPAFSEDPVRILRVARFAARYKQYGFAIAPETMQLMQQMVQAGEVDALVPERVWAEFNKALQEPDAADFICILISCDALNVVAPELALMTASPAVGNKALHALNFACQQGWTREVAFAALMLSLISVTDDAVKALQDFCKRLRVPKQFAELARVVIDLSPVLNQQTVASAELVTALEHADAYRRSERFEHALQAIQAYQVDASVIEHWQSALAKTAEVDVQAILADGFSGVDVRDELHRRRVSALG